MLWARRDWPRLLAKADENPVSGSARTPSRPVTSALGLCSRVDPLTQPARRARDRRARLMSDILFIKTSSLGDVIHHMPALAEARRRRPHARFSWAVEEAFAPLVRLHPAIGEVIPIAWRRWRAAALAPSTWREIASFLRALRKRG